MTTKMTTKIVNNADGDIIRKPMTLQVKPTMFATCKMLFRTQIDKFEHLPLDENEWRHGTWALYTEYRGLHYYLLIYDKDDIMNHHTEDTNYVYDKTKPTNYVYDKTNPLQYDFEAVRTNYKIPGLIMMPSEIKNDGDEINYERLIKYGIPKNDHTTDIAESLFYTDRDYFRGSYSQYHREDTENLDSNYKTDNLSNKQEELIDFVVLPYGYMSSFDKKHYQPREKGKNFISYYAPEIVSITKEKFDDTVNMIFKNASQKRNEKSASIVREISPLNDNCIEYVLQYVF